MATSMTNGFRSFYRTNFVSFASRRTKVTSSASAGSVTGRSSSQPCLAIRRETINAWERRAPLAPKHVRRLVRRGVKVLIQPSNRRAYPIQDYVAAGAIVSEDISEASLIMGVKTVPIESLIPDKTYAFFSHTIKAQKSNMPLLDAVLQRNIRLVDYEKMVDAKNQRLVAFGTWAGFAGMINIFHGLGLRLLALGHHTPFIHMGLAHNYRDSHGARTAIREAGYEIALDMMPRSLGPLTFVFTGSGNVSQGAQEAFSELPYEYVSVKNLASVAKHGAQNKIYGCVVRRDDHLIRKEGGKFDPEEYEQHPERYKSTFAKEIAPYASVIINGVFWSPNAPRLITYPDAKNLMLLQRKTPADVPGNPTLPHRLIAICDISADPGGSIEFMNECTTIDKPFCLYDADQNTNTDSFDSPSGVLVCSIDNMPAQMPVEATEYFGDRLYQYCYEMLKSDATAPFSQYEAIPEVKNAVKGCLVIASNGELTPNYKYISELRRQARSTHKTGAALPDERNVLLLGAGFVSGPVASYLCRDKNVRLTVATALQSDVERLVNLSPGVNPIIINAARDQERLEKLVKEHHLVISLLPYTMHPMVAKMCIKAGSNMVTASYYSPEMQALHKDAYNKGVTIVNEVGLDPGIDHLLAMECIDMVKESGGKIKSFISYCGGLPAPENSENPLRYKFNWSPRGVLLNTLSLAKYRKDGEIVEIPGGGGLLNAVTPIEFMPGFNLEGFPNRDSTVYGPLYNIDSAHTLLRGTLRYKGFCEAMRALQKLGLIDPKPHPSLDPQQGPSISWKEFIAILLNQRQDIFVDSLKTLVQEKLNENPVHFDAINKLGLFAEDVLVDREETPLDALTSYLLKKLTYAPGERDVAILRHDVGVETSGGGQEIHHVDLVAYGDPKGFSAMAATVGYTTAIVAKMMLAGEIQRKGMVLPMSKDIYRTVLQRLRKEGIQASERVTKL